VCLFGEFIFTDVAVGISSPGQYCKYVAAWSTVELGFEFRQVKRPFVVSTWTVGSTRPFYEMGIRVLSPRIKRPERDVDANLDVA
jgi:hypothetical protein